MRRLSDSAGSRLTSHLAILGALVIAMWALELLDLVIFRGGLNLLGIRPRTLAGLWGIVFAPFLHGSFGHLIANTVPFVVLGWFVMLRRVSDFFVVTVLVMLVSGFGVWLFGGANTVHIGASGLIFGYLGYLILRGFFERSVVAIVLAVVVGVLYGGTIWGVLPLQRGVSWEGHLFGFAGGALAARWLTARPRGGIG